MKLQIDTTNKKIKIEESVELATLVTTLEKMFPNGEWRSFTLETHTIIEHWSSPIVIREREPWPYRHWWEQPWYCAADNRNFANTDEVKKSYQLTAGVFNVQA